MAINVKKKVTSETVPVPAQAKGVSTLVSPSLVNLSFQPSFDELFPQLKLAWPIETDPAGPIKPEHAYHLGLFDGSSFEPISTPYTLTVIAGRNAVRKLIAGPAGKKYNRGFGPISGQDPSEAYSALMKDPDSQKGFSFIVGVAAGEYYCVAQFDIFGVSSDYWGRPLSQAVMTSRLGLQVGIADHSCNLKASRSDPTRKYLDPKKFRQREVVDLKQDDIQELVGLLETDEATFQAWLDQ